MLICFRNLNFVDAKFNFLKISEISGFETFISDDFISQGFAALTRTSLYILHIEVLTNALNSITTLGSFQYNFISWTVLEKLLPFYSYLLPIIVHITPLEFMLEVFHKQLLLNSCLKSATTHFPWIFASNFAQIILPCFNCPQLLSLKSDLKSPTNYFLSMFDICPIYFLYGKMLLEMSHKLCPSKLCLTTPQIIPSKIMLEMSHKLHPLEPCLISPHCNIVLEMSHTLSPLKRCLISATNYSA